MHPEDLKYTKTHEWVRVEGDVATVGLSGYAANELGDIVFVEVPEVGDEAKAGESIGSIESVKAVEELTSPVSGSVTAVNEVLADTPETVNEAPYEAGWMVKIKMSDPSELEQLLDASGYEASIESGT